MIIDMEGNVNDFLIHLAEIDCLSEAWAETIAHFDSLGIEGVVSILESDAARPPRVLSSGAHDVATLCADQAMRERDRTLRHMADALRPLLLDLGQETARAAERSREADLATAALEAPDAAPDHLAATARAAGFGAGMAVPARFAKAGGAGGLILLTRRAGPAFCAQTIEHGLALAYAATLSQMHLWHLAAAEADHPPVGPLTRREREVLSLSARGLTTREVGEALGISISGVNFHIANAARKLGANNRTHATSLALVGGHITP